MVKTRIYITSFFIVIGGFFETVAQPYRDYLDVDDARQVRMEVLDVFQKYTESMLYLDNPSKGIRSDFQKLFEKGALIYNDYLLENEKQMILPKEYAELRNSKIRLSPVFTQWNIGYPYKEDGLIKTEVEYVKTITISSDEFLAPFGDGKHYPSVTFHEKMIVVLEKKKGEKYETKIESVIANDPIEKYIFISSSKDIMFNLLAKYDEIGNIAKEGGFVAYVADSSDIVGDFETEDALFFHPISFQRKKESQADFYEFSHRRYDLFGVNLQYSPWGLGNTLNKKLSSNIAQKNYAFGISAYYGLQIASKKRSTWFFYMEAMVNIYKNIFSKSYNVSYRAVDLDGDSYLRKISLTDIVDKTTRLDVAAMPSFEYLFQVLHGNRNQLFLSFQIGGYAAYSISATNAFSLKARYTGVYDYFGGVEFNHYYDYGTFSLSDKEMGKMSKSLLNKWDFGIFGTIGVWYALDKCDLLKFSIGYKHGFMIPFKQDDSFILSKDHYSYSSPVQIMNNGVRNIYIQLSFARAIGRTI